MILVIQKGSNNHLRVDEDYAVQYRYDDIEHAVRDLAANNPAIVFYKDRRKSGSVIFLWTGKMLREIGYATRPSIADTLVKTMRFTETTEYAIDKMFSITSIADKLVKSTMEKTMAELTSNDIVISEKDANKITYAMGYIDAIRDLLNKLHEMSDRYNLRGEVNDGDTA